MPDNFNSREEWLMVAIERLRPLFKEAGHDVPKVRVACGWPARGGLGKKRVVMGECWDCKASEDNVAQIFISPRIKSAHGEKGALSVLTHELVHAVVGHEAKHGPVFQKLAQAVGLVGPATSCGAGPELCEKLQTIGDGLGTYPHSPIVPEFGEKKKQTTRMLKAQCETCEYTVRIAQKWVDVGAPHCPFHGAMFVEQPKPPKEDEVD